MYRGQEAGGTYARREEAAFAEEGRGAGGATEHRLNTDGTSTEHRRNIDGTSTEHRRNNDGTTTEQKLNANGQMGLCIEGEGQSGQEPAGAPGGCRAGGGWGGPARQGTAGPKPGRGQNTHFALITKPGT